MSDLIEVGLVGLGIIAETHLEVLAQDPDVNLQFTVDPRHTDPPSFRGRRPPHYRSVTEALASHQPDLVVIATPTDTHADLAAHVLTRSSARVLVEKPLVHDLDSLARLRALDAELDVRNRVFTAYHFAFSPEVIWAAEQLAQNPEWGPVTTITSAFYDPYVLRGDQAFASYVSSWMDSGINQLSMMCRFVELTAFTSGQQTHQGASAWFTYAYRSRGATGTARLRTSWRTGAGSKETTLTFGRSGVDMWIGHTTMTAFVARGNTLLAEHGNDGQTPRKVAHYRPLFASLLADRPDPILGFDNAAAITELHHAGAPRTLPDGDRATDPEPAPTAGGPQATHPRGDLGPRVERPTG